MPRRIALILADSGVGSVFFWSIVLILLIVAAVYGVLYLRRWLSSEDESPSAIGFTLADLRDLVRRGAMTADEYERAKAQMLEAGRSITAKMPHPLARPGKNGPANR